MVINEETIRNIVAESLKNMLSEKTLLKLGNSNPQPQSPSPAPAPMDPSMGGAPMDDPSMSGDMGGDSNAAPMDPSMGEDPNAMGDPSMGGAPMDDPSMEGDPSMGGDMGGDPSMGGEDGDDSTMSIINQLSDTDKEAVRSYAQSMLNRDESQNGGNGGAPMDDPSMEGDPNAVPMAESFIFTKKQMQMLRENFGPTADELNKEDERKPLAKKKTNKISSHSPFNSPKFK